ncbi:peptide MFS transporter [Gemmatimonadota bacterium]
MGHPRGLKTLFFTEMWERFSYYGMRALLVLFMTDLIVSGGRGMNVETATAIYGLFTFGVYALALPGGWIADKLLGQRKSVLYGGIGIAVGQYMLAIPFDGLFYPGLVMIGLGTGLLKPNVSAIVADLYPEGGARRDAGFSIFYMGINIGALVAPLVCSFLGENINWHLGFLAAGLGMTFGIIQYVVGWKYLGDAGWLKGEASVPEAKARATRGFIMGIGLVLLLTAIFVVLLTTNIISITLVNFARSAGIIVLILALIYFVVLIIFGCRDSVERKRVALIGVLFLGAAMFWSGFEQAGSSMNLFAERFTNRNVLGWEVPAGWLQSINPLFIIILAPVVGAFWIWLGDRNPTLGVKFGFGLALLGVGFLVMSWASTFVENGVVSPMWLVATYFFHTIGELALSPVGLSAITKLSPERFVSQMMGIWFLGAALGNLIAGLVAGLIETLPLPGLFSTVAFIVIGSGALFLVFSKPIAKLAGGIK